MCAEPCFFWKPCWKSVRTFSSVTNFSNREKIRLSATLLRVLSKLIGFETLVLFGDKCTDSWREVASLEEMADLIEIWICSVRLATATWVAATAFIKVQVKAEVSRGETRGHLRAPGRPESDLNWAPGESRGLCWGSRFGEEYVQGTGLESGIWGVPSWFGGCFDVEVMLERHSPECPVLVQMATPHVKIGM